MTAAANGHLETTTEEEMQATWPPGRSNTLLAAVPEDPGVGAAHSMAATRQHRNRATIPALDKIISRTYGFGWRFTWT